MHCQVTSRKLERVVALDVSGRFTLGAGCERLRDLIHVMSGEGHRWFLVNLAEVDFIDSYGVGELVRCHRIAHQASGKLKLVQVNKRVHDLLQVTHLTTFFEIFPEEQSALTSFVEPS